MSTLSDLEWDSEAYSENTDKELDEEINPGMIEPYQHEPVEEDLGEEASSEEDSMSEDESNAYEERLDNINW